MIYQTYFICYDNLFNALDNFCEILKLDKQKNYQIYVILHDEKNLKNNKGNITIAVESDILFDHKLD